MVEFIWKERVTQRKKRELEKRGVRVSKTEAENKAFLKAAEERGGVVFVEKDKDDKVKEDAIGSD